MGQVMASSPTYCSRTCGGRALDAPGARPYSPPAFRPRRAPILSILSGLKTIFTWWNGATVGIHNTVARRGRFVGEDELGNKYYEALDDRDSYDRGRKRRKRGFLDDRRLRAHRGSSSRRARPTPGPPADCACARVPRGTCPSRCRQPSRCRLPSHCPNCRRSSWSWHHPTTPHDASDVDGPVCAAVDNRASRGITGPPLWTVMWTWKRS